MRKDGLVIAILVSCAGGCTPYVFSPPARMVPMEAAKVVEKRDFALQGAIGGGAEIWGPGVFAGTVQGRYGFGRGFEGAAEVGFATIHPRSEWNTSTSHAIFGVRAGFKYEVASWFAVQAGFGGGGSGAGGYISPDGGVIFSYQGKHVVPFFSGGFYYSLPIAEKDIVFENDEEDRVLVLRADDTLGYYGGFGLRIPIKDFEYDGPRSAVLFGYRVVGAFHDEPDYGRQQNFYQLFTIGFEIVFRQDRKL